jgi:putative endonuclease
MRGHELGRRAELVVADELFARGFSVIGRNVRLGALELDVIARRGPLLVVVEVRVRGSGSWVGPFESVTRAKRARLLRAVDRFWRQRAETALADVERVRIDVAAVTFDAGRTRVEYAEGVVSG